jgi:hypothetical protein
MKNMQLIIARRILLTLGYTQQFDFPLTILELYSRLIIGYQVDINDFINSLKILQKRHLIVFQEGYFFLKGMKSVEIQNQIKIRKARAEYANKKWLEADEFIKFAYKVPFIIGVAVTGSVAMNNAVKNDDIDFMVVTTPHRLWITRLLVIFYATLKGKRRSFAKEEANSWCFNLWVEETDLQMPAKSRSIYEAYEVVQAQWVVNKNQIAQRFRWLNSWTQKVVYGMKFNNQSQKSKNSPSISLLGLSFLMDFFNFLAFNLQYWYMKPHMTREKVSKSHAFFHPRDTKQVVFDRWKQALMKLL